MQQLFGETKLFGIKMRPIIVLITLAVGIFLGMTVLSSCSRVTFSEGMEIMGASLDYKVGDGVKGSWDTRPYPEGSSVSWRKQNHDSYGSKMVLPSQGMDFFADTEFSPDCCGSTYSANGGLLQTQGYTSGGCACLTKQQMDYINTRGGNRTYADGF